MLQLSNVSVFYGQIQVLWDISIEVYQGEIVAIVGSNGAGKTTLLRAISGIIPIASGSIKFLGERIDDKPPHKIVRMGISQVPEGRRLFPYLNVIENLMLGAYIIKERELFYKRLEEVFRLFPILKERKTQLAGTLSGGEQQMLAIGRALMSNPKLLMLDEPSLGLAPNIVSIIFDAIEKLRNVGITILLIEQNTYDALGIADRAYVLENGRIALSGKGKELLNDKRIQKAYLGL